MSSTVLAYDSADLDARGAGHTAAEIAQQPEVWRQIGVELAQQRPAVGAFLEPALARPETRVLLAGAGSSAFAGQVLAPALARRLGRRVDAVATTDLVATPYEILAEDVPTLLVSFARSGDSPESVAATELADRLLTECAHLIVTCNAGGHLARDHGGRPGSFVLLLPDAANDRAFAMTSSFTGMILAALLALDPVSADAPADRLAAAAQAVLAEGADIARRVADREPERLVYLGSGSLAGVARESALKALELTAGGVVAMADSSLGFRHGPKSVLDERTVVAVYISNDPYTRRYDVDIVAELQRSVPAEHLLVIASSDADLPPGVATWVLPGIAGVPDAALGLPAVICAQLIGLALSLARGCTPDSPFPSGEVNRVVQGVTVHPLTD